MNTEDSNRVIQSIYSTTTDENNWREALDRCSSFVGASSAGLVVTDLDGSEPYEDRYLSSLYYQVDPAKLQYYRDHLRKYEHMAWDILKTLPPMTILSDDDYREQVAQQEDFVFFRENLGVDRRMVCRINDHAAWFDALAFQFDAKLQARPAGCEDQFRMILPHLSQTLQIGRSFWKLQREFRVVLGALNHIKIGLCVSHEGELVVVNQSAENVFEIDDGLSIGGNRKIVLHNSAQQAEFDACVAELSKTAQGKGQSTCASFVVERRSGKQSFLVEVSPLRDALGEIASDLAGALISIIDPTDTQEFDFTRFGEIYNLTEAELAVCCLIVQGCSNQEIAERRNVSEKTVKNQASSIYQKTETTSRASLLRKVVMTTPPIQLSQVAGKK